MLAPLEQLIEVRDHIRAITPESSIGITTNLMYKLKDEQVQFFKSLDGFGSSWDPDIRFENEKQLQLWTKNMATMVSEIKSPGVVLNVSVSKQVAIMDQKELLQFLKSTGAYKVLFDRITPNGNALEHSEIFPSNEQINNWYLNMHDASEELGARKWFYNGALEDVYTKFENSYTSCGTFCRDCEEKNFTINADGTIGGCPNSAPIESFGNISQSMDELLVSEKRVDVMTQERMRNPHCYECNVFQYCGSDCHRLQWSGDICASPRQLMKKLAGLPYLANQKPNKRVIFLKELP